MTPPDLSGPAVSVVIPTYQRREWVGRAVRSVLAQTFTDFELIVVDDGSTDGTEEALAGLDPRLRYVSRPNGGPGAARNTGIALARGSIVAFLDSDNQWLPCHLEVVTEVLALFPEAVLACTCPDEHIAGRRRPHEARLVDFLPGALADAIFGFVTCAAVRLDALEAVGGFAAELEVMEDGDLWLRLAALGPFALLQRRTIIHQRTLGSRLERGIASGAYAPTFETVSRRALEAVSAAERSDRPAVEAMTHGRIRYAAALRALAECDDESVAANLREACRLLPELSRQPAAVARRIPRFVKPEGYTRAVAVAADHWPDQTSDTALFLRLKAASAAVRSGQPGNALGLLRKMRPLPTVRFVLRNAGLWRRLSSGAIHHRLHTAREALPPSRGELSPGGGALPCGEALDLGARRDVADDHGAHRHE